MTETNLAGPEIEQAALALGEALRAHPALRGYQEACAVVEQDEPLRELEANVTRLYQELVSRQQAGELLASHEINQYYNLRDRLNHHPKIRRREEQRKALKALCEQAGGAISALLAVEYSSLAGGG